MRLKPILLGCVALLLVCLMSGVWYLIEMPLTPNEIEQSLSTEEITIVNFLDEMERLTYTTPSIKNAVLSNALTSDEVARWVALSGQENAEKGNKVVWKTGKSVESVARIYTISGQYVVDWWTSSKPGREYFILVDSTGHIVGWFSGGS